VPHFSILQRKPVRKETFLQKEKRYLPQDLNQGESFSIGFPAHNRRLKLHNSPNIHSLKDGSVTKPCLPKDLRSYCPFPEDVPGKRISGRIVIPLEPFFPKMPPFYGGGFRAPPTKNITKAAAPREADRKERSLPQNRDAIPGFLGSKR